MDSHIAQLPKGRFLIRPLRRECSDGVYDDLCRMIEQLGGVRLNTQGFFFLTAPQRSAAADLLAERFGTRYFELV